VLELRTLGKRVGFKDWVSRFHSRYLSMLELRAQGKRFGFKDRVSKFHLAT
jgi:hypothetical protein